MSRELERRWPAWPELARRWPARRRVAAPAQRDGPGSPDGQGPRDSQSLRDAQGPGDNQSLRDGQGPPDGQGPRPDEAARRAAERRRDVCVVVLTLAAGALDAATFLGLGKVFSSVITGNLVLIGIGAGQGNGTLALNGGLALGGYAAGVLAGAALAGTPTRGQPVWPRRVTAALSAELGIMVVFGGLWLATGSRPAGASRVALLILSGAAMGAQSATVRRLGEMSATYMTSTFTGVLTAMAVGPWPPKNWPRNVGVLVAMLTGGALGALAAVQSPAWVPAAVLVPVVVVLLLAPRR